LTLHAVKKLSHYTDCTPTDDEAYRPNIRMQTQTCHFCDLTGQKTV